MRSFRAGLWRLADPRVSMASMASITLGACAAARDGAVSWHWLVATVLGVYAIEVAKNASGEVVDWDSGVDQQVTPEERSPFSGGKRVLVDGLLTRAQTQGIAVGAYLAGVMVGLVVVWFREPAVLPLGLLGLALAYGYHAAPLRLAYRGLGELAVAGAYGPVICCGSYLVQRHTVPGTVVLLSLPLGALIGAFLWINEIPDARADRAAGKRTLVVRLGRRVAACGFGLLVATALLGVALLPLAGWSTGVLWGLAGGVPAVRAARTLWRAPDDVAQIVPAQGQALLAVVLVAVGSAAGILLTG